MKRLIALAGLLCLSLIVIGQLKTSSPCAGFTVDILDGKVNDILPTYTVDQIKGKLPCFTTAEQESSSAKCGGGVFYKDRDIYFYTSRDYVEIGPKFKGRLSIPLMGANRGVLFKWLGHPKIKEPAWDAYTTSYGTLILYYTKANKVNKIQFSSLGTESIQLCE